MRPVEIFRCSAVPQMPDAVVGWNVCAWDRRRRDARVVGVVEGDNVVGQREDVAER